MWNSQRKTVEFWQACEYWLRLSAYANDLTFYFDSMPQGWPELCLKAAHIVLKSGSLAKNVYIILCPTGGQDAVAKAIALIWCSFPRLKIEDSFLRNVAISIEVAGLWEGLIIERRCDILDLGMLSCLTACVQTLHGLKYSVKDKTIPKKTAKSMQFNVSVISVHIILLLWKCKVKLHACSVCQFN